ncbi:MAG: hypothetical protein V4631_07895 [Pseudomonadota bacterium]
MPQSKRRYAVEFGEDALIYKYTFADSARRYSLGIVEQTGTRVLSFFTPTPMADYEEIYAISLDQFALFQNDRGAAMVFIDACRRGENDHSLLTA